MTDVIPVAWRAVGSPPLDLQTVAGGWCGRCGSGQAQYATSAVVSRSFTAYDGWRDPSGGGLCGSCAWAYRTPLLRTLPHLITRSPVGRVETLGSPGLLRELSRPVDTERAVTVPLRPGRKHLLTDAGWGTVTTDDGSLQWTSDDAHDLGIARQLVKLGVSARALAAPAPPYATLGALAPDRVSTVLRLWPALDRWRQRQRPWLAAALSAFRFPTRHEVVA